MLAKHVQKTSTSSIHLHVVTQIPLLCGWVYYLVLWYTLNSGPDSSYCVRPHLLNLSSSLFVGRCILIYIHKQTNFTRVDMFSANQRTELHSTILQLTTGQQFANWMGYLKAFKPSHLFATRTEDGPVLSQKNWDSKLQRTYVLLGAHVMACPPKRIGSIAMLTRF